MKLIIRFLTWVTGFLLLLLIVFFLFRDTILERIISRFTAKLQSEKGLVITIGDKKFQEFFNVELFNIVATSPTGDTIAVVDTVFASPRVLSLLKGDPAFAYLQLNQPRVTLFKDGEKDNYSFFFKKRESDSDTLFEGGGYGRAVHKLIGYFFDQVPDELTVNNLSMEMRYNGTTGKLQVPLLFVKDESIQGRITFPSDSLSANYFVNGTIDRALHNFSGSVYSDSTWGFIPFLVKHYDLKLKADTLNFSFEESDFDSDVLTINGKASCRNFFADNWRIAPVPVNLKDAELSYQVVLAKDSFYLDSISTVRIDSLQFHPYFCIKNGKAKTYHARLSIPETNANAFFASLPEGIFSHTRDIRAKGKVSYDLSFRMQEGLPDSLHFFSEFRKKDFKPMEFGETDPGKLNGEFIYTAYDKGKPVRSFPVGPSHGWFTPLDQISPYLSAAVMTSEDGNFYYHNGFNADAFRKSIIENIKEKRFKRGGSTISMQLVKNVFLTRNKNISRKVEEAILTWMIESNRLVSKSRMLEVYLNIIEWGPGIYGIGEASSYYFGKHPSQLTLEESIFLAMIVPQPKGYRYHFNEEGHLKEHVAAYYRLLAMHLEKKGVISPEQQMNLVPDVHITGAASQFIKARRDTIEGPQYIREFDDVPLLRDPEN